jgi:hypothetical protein
VAVRLNTTNNRRVNLMVGDMACSRWMIGTNVPPNGETFKVKGSDALRPDLFGTFVGNFPVFQKQKGATGS